MQYGLIGRKLGHSYSCQVHEKLGGYRYELREMEPDAVPGFLQQRDFCAINVTIPYKETVMPYLDEISPIAASVGAVNTVVNKGGKLYGYNTDLFGMQALLRHAGITLENKKVLILGSGGTANTARACAKAGGAKEILTVSRSGRAGTVSYENALAEHKDAQIILQTTPVGMYPACDGQIVSVHDFPCLEGVMDAIYHPLRTNLVLEALEENIPAMGGLYMLVAQAVYASALFMGQKPDFSQVDTVYQSLVRSMANVVLIGMPSSGKSTVGKLLAKKLNMSFVDSDTEIVNEIGMRIADYFALNGEKAFREVETRVLKKLAECKGTVIATGGGCVLNRENIRALKRNGTVIFLDRELQHLVATADRPLSHDRGQLVEMFRKRLPLYRAAGEIHIRSLSTPARTAGKLAEALNSTRVGGLL